MSKEKSNKETCPNCNREFTWSNMGDVWPGGKDKESINCPYCGESLGAIMTSGYISTQKQAGE
jgi:uncharacterized Zn-finger protein